jgi:SAM-dependent methyltransferase
MAPNTPAESTASDAERWDARYLESERIWSGEPNAALVREVTGLTPGRALDLGCGEGGDAVWLARRGWRVTGVDISRVALERAARHAADAGVADRTAWQRHNLAETFPAGEYDLVSAHFLHSWGDMPRERILRRAAAATAPGGILLVVGHSGPFPWRPRDAGEAPAAPGADPSAAPTPTGRHPHQQDHGHQHGHGPHDDIHLPRATEVLASLQLPEDAWEVLRCEEYERARTLPDGTPVVGTDNTVKVRRRPA